MYWRNDPKVGGSKGGMSKPDWPRNGALLKGIVHQLPSPVENCKEWLEVCSRPPETPNTAHPIFSPAPPLLLIHDNLSKPFGFRAVPGVRPGWAEGLGRHPRLLDAVRPGRPDPPRAVITELGGQRDGRGFEPPLTLSRLPPPDPHHPKQTSPGGAARRGRGEGGGHREDGGTGQLNRRSQGPRVGGRGFEPCRIHQNLR